MSRRHYTDNAPTASLAVPIGTSDTSFQVDSMAGFPTSFPYTAMIDLGTASAELVLVTNVVSTTVTVTRNYDGNGAFSHIATAKLQHVAAAIDYDEANAHVNASSNVHGVTGSVVGTTDTQTLTNKSLTSPTLTGTVANSATNNLTGAGTALNVTNNAAIGGTLGVTGAVTASASGTALSVPNGTAAVKALTVSNGSVLTGDPTAGNALGLIPGKVSSFALYTRDSGNTGNKFTVDDAGNVVAAGSFSASGNIGGPISPSSFSNEAAAGTRPAGSIVYLTAPTGTGYAAGLFESTGSGWVPLRRSLTGAVQTLLFSPGGNTDTTLSGSATWVTLGNVTVPAWATSCVVNYTMNGIFDTGTTGNVAAQLKIGTAAGGVNKRILAPGVASQRFHVPISDVVSSPPTGSQSVTILATFTSGTAIRADAQSFFTASFQFLA